MDLFEQIVALRREGRPFAVATVVARRPPVSAHLGDRAIVFADGRMEGFIGGACSREIIRKQALEVLQARCGRLVSIRPDATEPAGSGAEHVVVPMTCVSEGAVDVYVEPFIPARRLVVVGATPVAEGLARLARSMGDEVVRVVDDRERLELEQEAATLGVAVVTLDALEAVLRRGVSDGLNQAAVVASQGHYDEQALESILRCEIPYVGLVASRKRGAVVRGLLGDNGVPGVERIRIPAGLDLGARTAPEVALSILAEVVQSHPSAARREDAAAVPSAPAVASQAQTVAIDPVCGMQVDITSTHPTAEVDGVVYHFCCANCRARFLKDPSSYRTGS